MSDARQTALAFLSAWAEGDTEVAGRYLAQDVTFESPRASLTGRASVLAAMAEFAAAVRSIDVLAATAEKDTAIVMYDMHTEPFGTIRAAECCTVVDGLVTSDRLVFDTALLGPG